MTLIDGIDFIGYQLRRLTKKVVDESDDDVLEYDPQPVTDRFVALMDEIEGEYNDHHARNG